MTQDTVALSLTAFFTFGCITIYEARQHARAMIPTLALVAICLGLFVSVVAMAERPHEEKQAPVAREAPKALR